MAAGRHLPRFGCADAPRPHPFLISVVRVARLDRNNYQVIEFVAQVIDRETKGAVYETRPQRDELDARVVAGLWIERQEAGDA